MFEKVSVLVPTRGRVERLRRMLSSYDATTRGAEELSELVFRVDEDDLETQELLRAHVTIVGPRMSGYASLPAFFNELAARATGDVLMCGNDDMVFKTPRWAVKILAEANRHPDGVFDFGMRTHNEAHYPFATVSKKVVEALGFIFDPRIFWGDIFLRDAMQALGRCRMLDVEIAHEWAGDSPDVTFVEGEKARRADWTANNALAVSDAVDKLRGLLV